ncbi:MAG: MnmC family methyltransferase [Mariprofundaceae bacterium]|nr:MnmC family methyltransferase [Mariprofundaceae bacterium]
MTPYELIDTVRAPGDGEMIRLYRHGDEFSIRVDKMGELMNSRAHHSEDVLAELACMPVANRKNAHFLVGGLGMGYTLAAALVQAGPTARVTVVELVPAVVHWNREYMGALAGFPLDDKRVSVLERDVGKVMHEHENSFDAIMLDVDNGPDGFTREDNDALYGFRGLNNAYDALKPGGVLTIWSAAPDTAFTQRLMKVGFDVEERRVRAHTAQRNNRHTIWIAARPG